MEQRCYFCGSEFSGEACNHCGWNADLREMWPSLQDYVLLGLLILFSLFQALRSGHSGTRSIQQVS